MHLRCTLGDSCSKADIWTGLPLTMSGRFRRRLGAGSEDGVLAGARAHCYFGQVMGGAAAAAVYVAPTPDTANPAPPLMRPAICGSGPFGLSHFSAGRHDAATVVSGPC